MIPNDYYQRQWFQPEAAAQVLPVDAHHPPDFRERPDYCGRSI